MNRPAVDDQRGVDGSSVARWAEAVPRLAVPAIVAFFQVAGSLGAAQDQVDRKPVDLLAILLLLVGPAALALLRRRPVAMAATTVAATVAYFVAGYPYGPVFLSVAVSLYWLVGSGRRLAGWAIAGVGLASAVVLQAWVGRGLAWSALHTAGAAGWLVVILAVGEIGRARAERLAEAERARVELDRRRASEERLQIAQELHDVLAHNISLISVQAGVGLHLMDEQPDKAREALVAIKQASKDALGELRSVLDLLRGTDEAAPRSPTAGLDQLDRAGGQRRRHRPRRAGRDARARPGSCRPRSTWPRCASPRRR